MKKVFIEFLREKNLLIEFIANLAMYRNLPLFKFLNLVKEENWIWESFDWAKSSEKFNKWHVLDKKWQKYAKAFREEEAYREDMLKKEEEEELAKLASSIPQY